MSFLRRPTPLLLPVFMAWALSLPLARGQDQDRSNPQTSTDQQAPDTTTEESAASPASPSGGGKIGPDYVVGPEDVLSISVFNVPELTETVRVENDGSVSVKLLDRMKVAGLTARQIKAKLESEWGKNYLENPEVTVFVKEFHAQPVSVIGAVEKPGLYQLPGTRTLIEVLSIAGGLAKRTSGAPGRYVYVTRKGGFGSVEDAPGLRRVSGDQIEINLKQLLYSQDVSLNIPIQPFDVVSVSKAGVVYVVGAVRKPGGFVLEDRENVTVLQALALAEGFSGSPAKGSVRLVRRHEDGSVTEIPIDLARIMKGTAQDPLMAANDILIVPDSTGKYVGKRGIETVISTIAGIAIFRGL